MASSILRPNADVVNTMSKSAGTTSWGALDDAVLSPTNARTGGDGVQLTSSTAAQEFQCDLTTFALPAGNVVSRVVAYVYCAGGVKRGIDLKLLTGATVLAGPVRVGASQAEGWVQVEYIGSLTQAQIDALRVQGVIVSTASGTGQTVATVYAAYVEVFYAAPDTTPPVPSVVSGPSRVKMSRVVGKDSTDVTFTTDEALTQWELRAVPATNSTHAEGTIVKSGGALAAGANLALTVTDDELVVASPGDGSKILKLFGRDAAGNWNTL